MGTINVFLRDSSANGLDDVQRLLAKLGVTGTATAAFVATVAANDDDRADAIRNSLANDPRVSAAAIVS